jgi:hypothetical protein
VHEVVAFGALDREHAVTPAPYVTCAVRVSRVATPLGGFARKADWA